MILSDFIFGKRPLTQLEYQTGFTTGHLRLESAFVEGSPQRIETVGIAPPAEGYEARSSLVIKLSAMEQN